VVNRGEAKVRSKLLAPDGSFETVGMWYGGQTIIFNAEVASTALATKCPSPTPAAARPMATRLSTLRTLLKDP
jgi:hypothetical protein